MPCVKHSPKCATLESTHSLPYLPPLPSPPHLPLHPPLTTRHLHCAVRICTVRTVACPIFEIFTRTKLMWYAHVSWLENFEFPCAAKNIEPDHGRIVICLDSCFSPSPVKVQQLKNEYESTDSTGFEVTLGRCRAEREAAAVRKTMWKAGLTPEYFAAVRLWSGHTWNPISKI